MDHPIPKKSVILHIGFEKTGSSAIQSFCARNRVWLGERNLDYPTIGNRPQHAVINARLASKNPARIHALIAEVRGLIESSPCDTVVFSHESLHLHNPQVLGLMLAGYDTRIVAYLRDPTQAAISHFATMIRFGRLPAQSPAQAVRNYSRGLLSCFDYYWKLLGFEAAFGRDRMIVRHYAPDALEGGQSTTDFLSLLGVDKTEGSSWPNAKANPSLDADQFLFVLGVAQRLRHLPRLRVMKGVKQVCDVVLAKTEPDRDRPFDLLVRPSMRRKIEQYYRPNLPALYERYFQGRPIFHGGHRSGPAVTTIDPVRLDQFETALAASGLMARIGVEQLGGERGGASVHAAAMKS